MINYLYESLGLKCKLSEWEQVNKLPVFLRTKIKYYILEIEGVDCILMKARIDNFKLSTLFNNVVQLEKYTDKPIVLWLDNITTYQRKVLIKNHISFIVPNSQLYLPFAAMSFKENLPSEHKNIEKLSPMGQLVILYIIYNKFETMLYQNQIAVDLKLSAMNVSRAIKELVNLDLVEVSTKGKQKIINPVSLGRDLYEISKEYIQSPIQKIIYVEAESAYLKLVKAGETALGARTMLNLPKHMCVALDRRNKEVVDEHNVLDIDVLMPGTEYVELQLWKYNPEIFADNNGVDVISLAASFSNCVDERVEAAVEEMLEEYKW